MQTLTIKAPIGHIIDKYDESTGVVTFKPVSLDIKERIQSIDDIFALNNTTQEAFETKWKGFDEHEIYNALEVLIVAAYNEGKLPDFKDGTWKYYPRFIMGSPSGVGFSFNDYGNWSSNSVVGARLVFHSENAKANMLDAVEKFLPQYRKSRTS